MVADITTIYGDKSGNVVREPYKLLVDTWRCQTAFVNIFFGGLILGYHMMLQSVNKFNN